MMHFSRPSKPPLPRPLPLLNLVLFGAMLVAGGQLWAAEQAIDRRALVERHSPHLSAVDAWAPLSVGNGQFCFTADVTGLQTFPDFYSKNGIAVETQARWSWHEDPNPKGYRLADANRPYTAHGQTVGYPSNLQAPAASWLRENPHAMPLGQLSLRYTHADGKPLAIGDIKNIDQKLDLWRGLLTSRYTIDGQAVSVITAVSPGRDSLAVRVESPLLASGRLAVRLALPRGYDIAVKANPPLDWSKPESHTTTVTSQSERMRALDHVRDGAHYAAVLNAAADIVIAKPAPHAFQLTPAKGQVLDFTLSYSAGPAGDAAAAAAESPASVMAHSAAFWQAFWQSGAAIDFSGSGAWCYPNT
jgi:hypothetical protein